MLLITIIAYQIIIEFALCMEFDRTFEKRFAAVDYINPFSTKFRYPTEYDIPDYEESKQAIKYAQNIMNFVLRKMTEPETGQTEIFK